MLRVAPLSVAGLLATRVFSRSTTVLTSATLTVGGAFDAMATAWGLSGPKRGDPPGGASTWDRRSSTPSAGILYVAAHLPPPGRDGAGSAEQLTEIAELVTAAGGRTLGLFSSMRAARAAAEAMRERLTTPVLCQGDDSTSALVEQFAADPATSLFGTLSLWQGVDVPGPSLSLVLIDRIPFPRPDDPLLSARQRAVAARGGNGFMAVAANHAALLLAQGSGRLLRRVTDRGVVAVLDSRMATARYGDYLRASLPPFWQTTNAAQVRAALQRLRARRERSRARGDQSELAAVGQHRMTRQHPHGVAERPGQRQRRRRREDLVAAFGAAGIRHLDGRPGPAAHRRRRPCPAPPAPSPHRAPARPVARSRSASASTRAAECPASRCCRRR